MKTFFARAIVLLLAVVMLSPNNAQTQDIGNLLSALDTTERALKKLIAKEVTGRKASDKSFATSLENLQSEMQALREQVASAGGAPGASDNKATARLTAELTTLKQELQSLRAMVNEMPKTMASTVSVSGADGTNSKAAPAKKKLPKHAKYHNLRYKDNYSYLKNPANRGNDVFDRLKLIPVGTVGNVSFGGQYRMRYESDSNRKLGASDPQSQGVLLNRLFIFGDLKIKKSFRLFTELKYATIGGNDLPASVLAHDKPDIENLFADVWFQNNSEGKFGMRIGRQELQFGKQRLISPLDWANTRRSFEGFRIMNQFGAWNIDAFVTKPVIIDPDAINQPDQAKLFSGAYASGKVNGNNLSFYFLSLTKNEPVSLLTGLTADNEVLTFGVGYDGKASNFDWSTEAAYQTGTIGTDEISAHMISLSGGYSFKNNPIKPRIGIVYDIASGDNDPTDNRIGTFNQLFPLGHAYFGWADQVGRRNIRSFSIQLSAKPSKFVVTKLNWFNFDLAKSSDALYNAGGKVSRVDPTGASGKDVGKELDAVIVFKPNYHVSMHIGYTHFSPGKFIENTGTSEAHDFFYVMIPMKF